MNVVEDAEIDSSGDIDCEEGTVKRLLFKNLNGVGYLTPNAKKVFNYLLHTLTKTLILQHFDPECHIQIEIDASGYAIGGILSKLILDDLGQWHLVAYYLQKMIPAKTKYETHNSELLAIVEAFKT